MQRGKLKGHKMSRIQVIEQDNANPEQKALLDQATRSDQPTHTFTRLVLRDDTLKLVFQQSAAFRERMFTHVRQRTGLAPGETLVLVDLGYSGTAQTRLAPVFKQAMDVDLFGLYLIASRVKGQQTDRKGLIDASWADERLILAMTAYIGLFEMMCTTPEASTVDYTEQGEPIRSQSNTARPQSEVVADIRAVGDSLNDVRAAVAAGWSARVRASGAICANCFADRLAGALSHSRSTAM